MCHSIEYLPRSYCTFQRHKENIDTSPIMCWKVKLRLLSLIAAIKSNMYQQQRVIRVANEVAKSIVKDARDKLAMTSLTQVLMHDDSSRGPPSRKPIPKGDPLTRAQCQLPK
jgi:hypothetical protein